MNTVAQSQRVAADAQVKVEVRIPSALAESLLDYLGNRPFREVAAFVQPLAQAHQVANQESLNAFVARQKADAVAEANAAEQSQVRANLADEMAARARATPAPTPRVMGPMERAQQQPPADLEAARRRTEPEPAPEPAPEPGHARDGRPLKQPGGSSLAQALRRRSPTDAARAKLSQPEPTSESGMVADESRVVVDGATAE